MKPTKAWAIVTPRGHLKVLGPTLPIYWIKPVAHRRLHEFYAGHEIPDKIIRVEIREVKKKK